MRPMNRQETTALLSALLKRDVLSAARWASEVKYRKPDGGEGRVDFMEFRASERDGITQPAVERGEFTCYEVKSCMDDYRSGHGLNFIGDWNYLVLPMGLYRQLPQEAILDVGTYVPLPNFDGRADREAVWREYEDPTELTPDVRAWKLHKMTRPPMRAPRTHGTAELLYCMLKAGK